MLAPRMQHPAARVNPGDKESPTNKGFFQNMKAQGWWSLARRFEKVRRVIQSLKLPREQWVYYPQEELISLCSKMPRLRQLEKELCQPTIAKGPSMKLVVNKTPEATRSPNLGDGTVMAYHPTRNTSRPL
jgi:phage terminase large subunit